MIKTLKSGWLWSLCLMIVGCGATQAGPDAREILKSVEAQYKSMKTFELQAVLNSTVKSAGQNQNSSFPIYFARKDPGQLRIEVSAEEFGMTIVSDGNTTWTYLPSTGEYKTQRSSVVQTGAGGNTNMTGASEYTDMGEQLVETYKMIAKNLESAKVVGTEKVTMADGSQKDAYKIEATYKKSPDFQGFKVSPTTYLIDKKTHLVLKQSLTVESEEGSSGAPVKMYQTVDLKSANLQPSFSDSVFSFTPPEDAKEVQQFAFEQGMQNGGSPMVGQEAPEFELETVEGKQLNIKDLRGKVVVLDFWATWCGPCREAHPHIQKLYEQYKDDGLVVLGINSESKEKVRQYMSTNGYTFMNVMDPEQVAGFKYHVNAIPSVFVINKEGVISSHLIGFQPESKLQAAIEEAGI